MTRGKVKTHSLFHHRLPGPRLLACVIVFAPLLAWGSGLVEVANPPVNFEASDLLAIQSAPILEAKAWDCGFWTVSDEKAIQKDLAIIGHDKGAPLERNWHMESVHVPAAPEVHTDDAEVLCRYGEWIYVLGSHFGKKGGPLKAARQFVARFREDNVDMTNGAATVSMDIRNDAFALHRLINDALAAMRSDLIETTAIEQAQFIAAAQHEGAEEHAEWADRLHEGDWPLNIEGADFLDSGSLLIGLRYPVTRAGHPLLVKIEHVDSLFTASPAPRVAGIHVVENVGDAAELTGIRSLRCHGGAFHIITGAIDGRAGVSLVLRQHPTGASANCAQYTITLPLGRAAYVQGRLAHAFEKARNVEGIAFDARGREFYIEDASGTTPLLFWQDNPEHRVSSRHTGFWLAGLKGNSSFYFDSININMGQFDAQTHAWYYDGEDQMS